MGNGLLVQAKKTGCYLQGEMLEKAGDSKAVDVVDMVLGLWAHNARKDMCWAHMMKKKQTRV